MHTLGIVRMAAAFAILVVLHFTLRPVLGWKAAPDFLIIALLLVAIRMRPGIAAVAGFAIGLVVVDTLALHAFGAAALAMTMVAYVASRLKAVYFADDLSLTAFFFFLGKWAFDVLYLLADGRGASTDLLAQMFFWSPLSACVTALAGLATLVLLRPLLRASPA
jgi:rod shape-determining protein MreD